MLTSFNKTRASLYRSGYYPLDIYKRKLKEIGLSGFLVLLNQSLRTRIRNRSKYFDEMYQHYDGEDTILGIPLRMLGILEGKVHPVSAFQPSGGRFPYALSGCSFFRISVDARLPRIWVPSGFVDRVYIQDRERIIYGWKDHTGDITRIADLRVTHLQNIVKFMLREKSNGKEFRYSHPTTFEIVERELDRRSIMDRVFERGDRRIFGRSDIKINPPVILDLRRPENDSCFLHDGKE